MDSRRPPCWAAMISGYILVLFVFQWAFTASAAPKKEDETIDWVDIAYGKARVLGGHAGPQETIALLNRLLGLGHLETVQMLLEKSPPLPAAFAPQRLDLELQLAQANYFRHEGDEPAQQADRQAIEKLLLQLSRMKQLLPGDLIRFEKIAEQFDVGEAVTAFCTQLAGANAQTGSQWWLKAGDWHFSRENIEQALAYYRKAFAGALSEKERKRALLSKLNAQWLAGRSEAVITELETAVKAGVDAKILEHLAHFALEIERPDLAWRLYARLGTIAPDQGSHWIAETARWAIAANQPLQAAGWLDNLAADILPTEQQDELLYSRFNLLRQGNQVDQAMHLAQRLIKRRPEDAELLEHAVQLALVSQNVRLADQWSRALIALKPEDRSLLKRQAEISIALQEPQKAIEIVRRLCRKDPCDETGLFQLAQLEEWTGNPLAALGHLQDLSDIDNRLEVHEQVYRLSRTLNEYQAALDALHRIAALRPLSDDELKERIYLFERVGDPDTAVIETKAYLEENPEEYRIWLELAHLQMRNWQYRQALNTLERVAAYFGRHGEETFYRCECYWKMGAKRKALEVIESFPGELSGPDNRYHAGLLVELGWRYRRPELARKSLESLLKHYDETQFFVLTRLIKLQSEGGRYQDAVDIALRSARETGDQRFIPLALEIAEAGFGRIDLTALEEKIKSLPGDDDLKPRYWSILARRNYARKNFGTAFILYQKALAINKDSFTALEGSLWSLLSAGNDKRLTEQLDNWQTTALEHSELWLVYAVSRQFLGQYRRSGFWYERLIQNGRQDYGILLGYADLLDELGAFDRAYRLRMYAMQNLRGDAAAFLESPGKLTDTVKSYAALMHRYGYAQQAEYWLETLGRLSPSQVPPAWLYELAISWYLNSKRPVQAKIWLAKAHEQRIQTSKWQEIFLALAEKDEKRLAAFLKNDAGLDLDSRAQILEALDRRQEALHVSEAGMNSTAERERADAARFRAAVLKQEFPANLRSGVDAALSDQLERREVLFGSRYTFQSRPIGLDINLRSMEYDSSIYLLENRDRAVDLELTAYLGNGKQGGSSAVGFNGNAADQIGYGRFEYHHRFIDPAALQLKLVFQEVPRVDSILQIGTLQNRLDAVLSGLIRKNYYYHLDLWGREYLTRNGHEVARGAGGIAEMGYTQHWGRFQWNAGIQGNGEKNLDRRLPDDLKALLPAGYTVDSVVAPYAATVLVGGRIGRGNIRETSPVTGALRYFLSAWVGRTDPQNEPTANLQAGAGIRILGHDELSFEMHYNQSGGVVGHNDDYGLSMQYRYFF